MAQCSQVGVRTVRLALQTQIVLLGFLPVMLPKAEVVGALEQRRVVDVQPERAMDVAAAERQARQRGTVSHHGLEHRLLARRVAQLDTGNEVGGHLVSGGGVRPDLDRLHQELAGLRRVVPREPTRHGQTM